MAHSAMCNLDDSLDTAGQQTDVYDVPTNCNNYTDVWFEEVDLPTGYRGYAPCVVPIGFGLCDRVNVQVDAGEIFVQNGGFSGNSTQLMVNLVKTYHHEAGHSAGVGHSSGVHMMQSGHVPADWAYWQMLPHDSCHINSYIPGGASCTP